MILQDCTGISQQGQNWKPDLLTVVQLLHHCPSFLGFICISHKKKSSCFPPALRINPGVFLLFAFLDSNGRGKCAPIKKTLLAVAYKPVKGE